LDGKWNEFIKKSNKALLVPLGFKEAGDNPPVLNYRFLYCR
jgi:hypothetical protein